VREELPINRLGLGPCRHMEAVLHDTPMQVPLCDFLGVDMPAEPFPRTNHRPECSDQVTGNSVRCIDRTSRSPAPSSATRMRRRSGWSCSRRGR